MMGNKKTQFSADKQPKKRRGLSFRSKFIAAIKEESLLDAPVDIDDKGAEKLFIKHAAGIAFNADDPRSGQMLKEIFSRVYPALKATMPTVEFEFDVEATPSDKVAKIIEAASRGQLPPDVASMFVSTVKAAVDIEAATDLKERLEILEKMIDDRT